MAAKKPGFAFSRLEGNNGYLFAITLWNDLDHVWYTNVRYVQFRRMLKFAKPVQVDDVVGQGIIDVDGDDLPVRFTLVDQGQGAKDFDFDHGTTLVNFWTWNKTLFHEQITWLLYPVFGK